MELALFFPVTFKQDFYFVTDRRRIRCLIVLPSEEAGWLQLLQTLWQRRCALDAHFVTGGWSLQQQPVVKVEAWAMRSSLSAANDRIVHG